MVLLSVINGRRLSNARIARGVAFTALLFIAMFIYDVNKNPLTLSYHPSSLNKTRTQNNLFVTLSSDETQTIITNKPQQKIVYQPADTEKDIMIIADELGFNKINNPRTCQIWNDPNATTGGIYDSLTAYTKELDEYNELIRKFEPVSSIMDKIKQGQGGGDEEQQSKICDSLRLHPNGLEGIFPSLQLSFGSSGYVEPLLPPMRSHNFCTQGQRHLMSLDYLVHHDFEFMCRQLKPTSKLILLDMGAALDFHGNNQPIVTLMRQYEKFGFVFDHIYGFEISKKDPKEVYETSLPEEYMASYHWINVGVSAEEGHKLNPLHSILKKFSEDDFVVVKLDIDTPAVELPLFRQLLEDKDGIYSKIIDQFYFEHHHYLGDLAPNWKCGRPNKCNGTVADSLEMFSTLRKNGITAHYWP